MPPDGSLRDCRVLLVEDETLVALLIEDMLEEMGCLVAGFAASVEEGVRLAESVEIDVAILDVNVGGAEVWPVAQLLAARDIPVLFSSGYGFRGLPEPWRRKPVIGKPFLRADLEAALASALSASGTGGG